MNWKVASLESLAAPDAGSFVDGPFGSDLKTTEYLSEGVPILRLQNIRPGYFRNKDIKFISPEKANALARHNYRPGDLVIAKLGDPPCMTCVLPVEAGEGIIVADVVRFRGHPDKVSHRFLSHYLNSSSARKQLARETRGSTRARINLTQLKSLEVPVPPINEQERIAAIFDKADAIRRKREKAIELTASFLKATFLEMFWSSPSRIEWPELSIQELVVDKKGAMRTGPFGSALRHSEFVDSGIAVLGIDNAVQNRFSWDERRFISAEKYEEMQRYTVYPGDVIITIMGTTGRSAVVPDDIPTAISTKHLATLTLNRKIAEPEFIAFAIHSHPGVLKQIRNANRGAIMDGLNLGIIKNLSLNIPPIQLQRKFAAIVAKSRDLRDKQADLFLGNKWIQLSGSLEAALLVNRLANSSSLTTTVSNMGAYAF